MNSVFQKDMYRYLWHKNPLRIPGLFLRDLKYCVQRIRRGYSDRDALEISQEFLAMMPEMLTYYKKNRMGSPGTLGQNYTNADGILVNDTCHAEWDEILDRMVFLLREANEDTCQKKNPYEDEFMRISDEFSEKYGFLGEKLSTPDENKGRGRTVHFPSEIPEYKEISDKYFEEEKALQEYRQKSLDEALALFSKWFYDLSD